MALFLDRHLDFVGRLSSSEKVAINPNQCSSMGSGGGGMGACGSGGTTSAVCVALTESESGLGVSVLMVVCGGVYVTCKASSNVVGVCDVLGAVGEVV